MRLDLGSGPRPAEGYEGVDIRPHPRVVHDVNLFAYPWPWPDGCAQALYSSHLVEHVPDLIGFMDEAWRICEPGAEFRIVHPYQHSNRAWQDPTHVRALNESTWAYFSAPDRRALGVDHYGIKADFEVSVINIVLAPNWSAKREAAMREGRPLDLTSAMRHGVNVIDDLEVVLVARK